MKVLFVCTGNTCRSPMAEGIFRRLVMNDRLEDRIFCQSAGLSASEGSPASEHAVTVCAESGIDLSHHKARILIPEDVTTWDLYFPMTKTHAYILEQAGIPASKIYTPNEIPDPYGQDCSVYRAVKEALEKEVKSFYNGEVQRLYQFEKHI